MIVSYVYGDDLISQNREGAHSYYHYDAQSSTRMLTNAAETVTDTYIYDAFGSLTDQAGVTANNYLYTGEQYDQNVEFYYLRARYYSLDTGMFTAQDPWRGFAYDPLSLNKYLYANADPINNVDPGGRMLISMTARLPIMNVLARISTPTLIRALSYSTMAIAIASGWMAIKDEMTRKSSKVITFPGNPPAEDETYDDEINCDEWLNLLNQQYERILIFDKTGANTTLLKKEHNKHVDIFCSDPDCGYLCPYAKRFEEV